MKKIIETTKEVFVPVLYGLLAVVTGSGAINTGEGLYIVAGILNIAAGGWTAYRIYKEQNNKAGKA